jgi:hypothetical protein
MNQPDDEQSVDRLLRSDDMARGGVHIVQWKGDHWRCGCGREFKNSDVDIAAWVGHAPDAKALAVMSSRTDPDVQVAAARIGHALATRIPDGERFIQLPISSGREVSRFTLAQLTAAKAPRTLYIDDPKGERFGG